MARDRFVLGADPDRVPLLVLGKVAGLTVLLVLGNRGRRWVNRNARRVTSPVVVLATAGPVSAPRHASVGTNPAGGVAA
jgi:hypothetical protein